MRLFILLVFVSQLLVSCEPKEEKEGFRKWYKARYEKKGFYRDHPEEMPSADSLVVSTNEFLIDTLYGSMQGPFQDLKFTIPVKDSLMWLTGYKVETYSMNDSLLSKKYLGYNSLNFGDQLLMPWRHELNYFNLRVFTIGQDGKSIQLPNGFGIPVFGSQNFTIEAQVLNYNDFPIDLKVKQVVTIFFYPESKLNRRMIPLEQRTVFAFKQYEGPEGLYGEAVSTDNYTHRKHFAVTQPRCLVNEIAQGARGKTLNLFHDPYGRLFTGHWKLSPGIDEFTIDISSLLQLEKSTRIHYVNALAHPFCTSISLLDLTKKDLVFESEVFNSENTVGIDSINDYNSAEGKVIFPDHSYAIQSSYHNNSEQTHSGMAVLYLYLQI